MSITLTMASAHLEMPRTYPPDTTMSLIATPNLALPAMLTPFSDPAFPHVRIERIYNVTNVRNYYAKRQAWNCDNTYIFLGDGQGGTIPAILDANTYAVVNAAVTGGQGIWSESEPQVVYRANNSTGAFFRFNVITNTNLGTLRTFAYATGSTFDMVNQGSLSDDGRYILLQGKTAGGVNTIIVYDIIADTFETLAITTMPHAGGMSHSGQYLHLNWDAAGTGDENGIWLFDRHLTRVRQVAQTKTHADFNWDTLGNEVLVYATTGAESISTGSYWRMHRLSDGVGTNTINWDVNNAYRNGHVSGRNSARPGWAYHSSYLWAPADVSNDQIVAIKLDGAQPPTVEVYGMTHHFDTTQVFEAMPLASPNRDGTKVAFGSEWGGDPAVSYAYVASVA